MDLTYSLGSQLLPIRHKAIFGDGSSENEPKNGALRKNVRGINGTLLLGFTFVLIPVDTQLVVEFHP